MQTNVTIGVAFFAGLASFLSPCVFVLVPAYISYLGGRSAAAGSQPASSSLSTLSHGFAFVIGFSLVFVGLGALAGALGGLLSSITAMLVKVGGLVLIVFGLHMTRVIQIPILNYDLRPQSPSERQRGYLSSALMGVFFSAGWTPCVGPVLGAILTLSFTQASSLQGAKLLSVYSAGLAIPFLLAATQIGWVTAMLRRYNKVMHWSEMVMGVILVIIGVVLISGRMNLLMPFDVLFEILDEVQVGRAILLWLLFGFAAGMIPALVARSKGKNFFDHWFLASGIVLILLLLLFMLGVFPFMTTPLV